jgi:hypothetical protein
MRKSQSLAESAGTTGRRVANLRKVCCNTCLEINASKLLGVDLQAGNVLRLDFGTVQDLINSSPFVVKDHNQNAPSDRTRVAVSIGIALPFFRIIRS